VLRLLGRDDLGLNTWHASGNLELPREGEVVEGDSLAISGWAWLQGRAPARVEVSIDGVSVGRAAIRVPRPDLAALPGGGFGPLAGFDYRGPIPASAGEAIEITVALEAYDGERVCLPSRTVRRSARACTAEETARAETLRDRTEEVIKRVGRHPRHDGFRLLVFTHSLSLGGGELYLSELLRQLAPDLRGCTVVSPTDGELRARLESWGLEVVVTEHTWSRDVETYEGRNRELSLFILGMEPDLILLNTLGAWPAGDAAQRLGIPTIWAIHESFELDHWLEAALGRRDWHPYLKERLIATLAGADRLIFEAEATSRLFAPYSEPHRRRVVRYGVDVGGISRFQQTLSRSAARAELGIGEHEVVLLSVGVIGLRKASACLIEAFIAVAAGHPEATLVMVGDEPGQYSEVLHELIDTARLGRRLRLLPTTPDIWSWYASSDVLVLASDIESLPRSMLEAMAFGVPCLSTDVFGVPEVIEDGRNGWLFPPRDMVAMVAALTRVLEVPPDERRAAGEACRAEAARDHRSEGYVVAYRQMFAELTPLQAP
jgi:glycosyltransferase involved in cell wall biosynthesis